MTLTNGLPAELILRESISIQAGDMTLSVLRLIPRHMNTLPV